MKTEREICSVFFSFSSSIFKAKYSFLLISLPIPILFITFAVWMPDFRVGLHKTLWVKQKHSLLFFLSKNGEKDMPFIFGFLYFAFQTFADFGNVCGNVCKFLSQKISCHVVILNYLCIVKSEERLHSAKLKHVWLCARLHFLCGRKRGSENLPNQEEARRLSSSTSKQEILLTTNNLNNYGKSS